MKSALILHAWLNGPDKHWYPWLKKELEKRGYTVYLPEIPTMNTNEPDLATQMKFIEGTVPLNNNMLIFGHSLGCLLAMRLAEKHAFAKMFLVAGWDFDDLYPQHKHFWPNKMNHMAIKKNCKEIYCLSSDNDPYMTAFEVEEMSKRLNGKFILMKGAGHFTKEFGITKIPELIQYF
ncbi:MAG: alpha/beta hydrolase [Patescibacteria group bacterium]